MARQRIDTLHCPVCMQYFHTRERVICQIEEKSERCKAVVLHTFPPLPQHVVAKMDADDAVEARHLFNKGRRRHHAGAVMSRLQGPLLWEAFAVGISHASLLRTTVAAAPPQMITNICVRPQGADFATNCCIVSVLLGLLVLRFLISVQDFLVRLMHFNRTTKERVATKLHPSKCTLQT